MKAIILAGGKGTRMGRLGQLQFKTLLPVPTEKGIQPVINSNVDKLLLLSDIEKILVLIKEDHREQFERWQRAYYPQNERIALCYEEELQKNISELPEIETQRKPGAIWGLYLAILGLKIDEPLIVVAGDNYFTDGFQELVRDFQQTRKPTIVYHDLRFRELVRSRFGIIRLARNGRRVVEFVEKPQQPLATDTKAAIACYVLPSNAPALLELYVKETEESLDAPGHLLQWLIRETEVDAFEFRGRWWDVGTGEDYADVLRLMSRREIRTVADLMRAKMEGNLPDSYFLVGRRFEFETNNLRRTMKVLFREDDLLCKRDDSVLGEGLMTIAQIKERKSTIKEKLYELKDTINSTRDQKITIEFPENAGVLLSGGVFLYDAPPPEANGKLYSEITFVPMLERDYAAPADPGRLTTPAGRLDDLNLSALCYSELLEELVFYGLDRANNVRLFTIFPYRLREQYEPKKKLINRLLSKQISIPGVDAGMLAEQVNKPEPEIDIVEVIDPVEVPLHALQNLPVWRVEIRIEEHLDPESAESVYIVFDEPNCTIEFRKVVCARISEFDPYFSSYRKRPAWVHGVNTFGRLMGITDGDGYRRRTFLMSAEELSDYYRKIQEMTKEQLVEFLLNSQVEPVRIAAVGDGANAGRFNLFDVPVPALPLTTSVTEMAKLTYRLFEVG